MPSRTRPTQLPALWVNVVESYRALPGEPRQEGYQVHGNFYVANARISVQIRLPGGLVVSADDVLHPSRELTCQLALTGCIRCQLAFITVMHSWPRCCTIPGRTLQRGCYSPLSSSWVSTCQ